MNQTMSERIQALWPKGYGKIEKIHFAGENIVVEYHWRNPQKYVAERGEYSEGTTFMVVENRGVIKFTGRSCDGFDAALIEAIALRYNNNPDAAYFCTRALGVKE